MYMSNQPPMLMSVILIAQKTSAQISSYFPAHDQYLNQTVSKSPGV